MPTLYNEEPKMLLLQRGNARPGGIKEKHQDLTEGEQLQLRLAGRALLCVGGNGAQLDGQEIDTGGKGAYHREMMKELQLTPNSAENEQ